MTIKPNRFIRMKNFNGFSIMNKILLILLLFTSKSRSQEIEDAYWSARTSYESPESLFDVTGYPLTGDLPLLNRKVFKGLRVNIREHPYIVSIRRLYSHYLTGTLITKNVILTVAHPIYGVPVYELRAVVGENYADRGTTLLTVILVIIHQDFDKYTLVGDLAMIRIYEDVIFKSNVKSISLVAPHIDITNSTAFVTGWGRCDQTGKELCLPRGSQYYPDEKMDSMLRTISLTITSPNYYCQGYKRHETPIRKGMFCTGMAREDNPTFPCLAVPGAPLVVRGKLAAILSWGFGCGYQNDLPLIYTDIKFYIKWITQNVVTIRKLLQTDFEPLFEATRSFILLEWFTKTRILEPKRHFHLNKKLQMTSLDKSLISLRGKIFDLRDAIFDKKYQHKKEMMYQEIQILINEENKTKDLIEKFKIFTYTEKPYPFFSNKSLLELSSTYEDYSNSEEE